MLRTPSLEGPLSVHGLCILARKDEQLRVSKAQCQGKQRGEDGEDTSHEPESSDPRREPELDIRWTASSAFWETTLWTETQNSKQVSSGKRTVPSGKALADGILPMSLKTSVEMFIPCLFPFLLSSFLEDIGRGRLWKERDDINGDGSGSRK